MILGFLGVPGLDPYESALAGALFRGEFPEAGYFIDAVKTATREDVLERMRRALQLEEATRGAGADFLVRRSRGLLQDPGSIEATAAQDSRGNCCATDPWRWQLSPREWPYGRCGPDGCPETGSLDIEIVVNIFDFPQVSYDHHFRELRGPEVRMDAMSVKMKRDRGGGPDPTLADYECPDGELPLSCQTDTRESGTGVDEYYYVSTRFAGKPAGEPGWTFEFQSRRWKVRDKRDADFPAHNTDE